MERVNKTTITNNVKEVDSKKITPLYVAQKCPVCNGFGTLKYGEKVCDACKGKCYVLVPNFKEATVDKINFY